MTNDELGRIVKTELGKIITVLNQILIKLGGLADTPRKQDETRIGPQKNSQDKHDAAPEQILAVTPSPTDTNQAKQPANASPPRRTFGRRVWRQTKRIFLKKDRLERVGIMFGVAYAVTTILQWHDLRHNFEVDQRAWIKTEFMLNAEIPRVSLPMKVINVGKSPALWTVVDAL